MKTPFVIAETALHGEGNLAYYQGILTDICDWWTGWPRIVFKTQYWHEEGTPWYKRVVLAHGRPPLVPLSLGNLQILSDECRRNELGFCVTAHDVEGARLLADHKLDYLKLGSVGAADGAMREVAFASGHALIMSTCLTPPEVTRQLRASAVLTLSGTSAYPANHPWTGGADGFTCHSVPGLIHDHVLGAIKSGAAIIEVHVSERDRSERPLPGDMCVSLNLSEFQVLCEAVGEKWIAQ